MASRSPYACSGDMYAGVPSTSPSIVTRGDSVPVSSRSRRWLRTSLSAAGVSGRIRMSFLSAVPWTRANPQSIR